MRILGGKVVLKYDIVIQLKLKFPGGIIHWLEKLLNRKVFWVICAIHTNELPLRHLIEVLGKNYPSSNRFLFLLIFFRW